MIISRQETVGLPYTKPSTWLHMLTEGWGGGGTAARLGEEPQLLLPQCPVSGRMSELLRIGNNLVRVGKELGEELFCILTDTSHNLCSAAVRSRPPRRTNPPHPAPPRPAAPPRITIPCMYCVSLHVSTRSDADRMYVIEIEIPWTADLSRWIEMHPRRGMISRQ